MKLKFEMSIQNARKNTVQIGLFFIVVHFRRRARDAELQRSFFH